MDHLGDAPGAEPLHERVQADAGQVVEAVRHQSDSRVQRDAEEVVLRAAAAALGVRSLQPARVRLADGVHIEVDGVCPDRLVFAEAYARQGRLKDAQLEKISQDVLKLSLLRRTLAADDVRAVIVLASSEAERSIRGWVRHAADVLDVAFLVVALDESLRTRITDAQRGQLMVTIPEDLTQREAHEREAPDTAAGP